VGVGVLRIRIIGEEAGGGRKGGSGAVDKSRSGTSRRNRSNISRLLVFCNTR
jgi:hypothetical protein